MEHPFRVLVLIGCFSVATCGAQYDLDSLERVWNDPDRSDSLRLDAMYNRIWEGYLFSQPDSAIILAHKMRVFSVRAGDKVHEAMTMNVEGIAHNVMGEYEEAEERLLSSLALYESINYSDGMTMVLGNLGVLCEYTNDLDKALTYNMRTLEILRKENDRSNHMAIALTNTGGVHEQKGDFARAIEYMTQGLQLHEKNGDKEGKAQTLTEIARVYAEMGDTLTAKGKFEESIALCDQLGMEMQEAKNYTLLATLYYRPAELEKAMDYYQNGLEISRKQGFQSRIGDILMGMGEVLVRQGKEQEAESSFKDALSIFEETEEEKGVISGLAHLGDLYLRTGRVQEAITISQDAQGRAQRSNDVLALRGTAQVLYEAYKRTGNYRLALENHELYMTMRDSVLSEGNQRELLRQEYKYSYEKEALADSLQHATEMTQLQSERTIEELRADRNRNSALATGGGALLLLTGGGAWFYTDRKRRQERFEKEAATLETQALRSQMNPHFIFNALNSINAFVQKNDPDNATSFLTKFARVMRSVLENSRHSEVPLQEDLDTLRGYMDLERKRMNEQFDFTIEVAEDIDPEEVMVPPLVVQPFVENAIWHGMKDREDKGHITLRVKKQGQQLVWQIEDDGAGRHAKKDPSPKPSLGQPVKKTSLGTAITRSRLDLVQKQHGGKAGFRYEDLPRGTRVIVEMPLLLG